MSKGNRALYTAIVLVLLSFVSFAVILPAILESAFGRYFPVSSLGKFLFDSFSYVSLYVPIYLFTGALLVLNKRFEARHALILTLSIFPFLTTGLLLGLFAGVSSPGVNAVVKVLGRNEGIFLLFLLFLIEILLLYIINFKLADRQTNSFPFLLTGPKDNKKEVEPPPETNFPARVPLLGKVKSPGQERDSKVNSSTGAVLTTDIPDVPSFKDSSVMTEDDFFEDEHSDSEPPFEIVPDSFEFTHGEELWEETKDESMADPDEVSLTPEKRGYKTEEDPEVSPLAGESVPESAGGPAGDVIPKAAAPPFKLEIQKIKTKNKNSKYEIPTDKILNDYSMSHYWLIDDETRKAADVLKSTLEEFKIKADVTGIKKGPVITMFEILPAPGVKLSKIVNLADNIALRLAASRIRIVAPIPGKHAVGIEVPNRKRAIVSFKEMLNDDFFNKPGVGIPIVLGKDITGESQIVDLVATPHLLIAGATGSGKSVCVNSIICSILYKRKPEDVRIILIDPKIVELKLYNGIPHLLTPVITEPKRAFQVLQYCLYEMERRYSLLDSLGVRDIRAYNRKLKKGKYAAEKLPYIVVVVDEFADLIAASGKELESILARLSAMARAIGIHLVLATQRPSIDVITGLIKANIPSRIAFMVANKIDSRIILDSVGADKLLGKGDMLFASAWDPSLMRIQGAFVSDEEVERLTEYVKTLGEPEYIDEEIFFDEDESSPDGSDYAVNDPLMSKSIGIVAAAGKASASYLQRRLKIGYNRAARIVEDMEARGIVGPQNGSKPREVIHIPDGYKGRE